MDPATDRLAAGLDTAPPESAALRFAGGITTAAEWRQAGQAFAAALTRRGLAPGDRIAVLSENRPEVLIAALGHLYGGFVHVPINSRYRALEIEHILGDSDAGLVLVDRAHAPVLRETPTGRDLPHLVLDGTGADSFATALEATPPQMVAHADEATAVIIYTSGTTGPSKGVELTYGALSNGIGALTELWGWSAGDRLALALPLFHVHGLGIGVYGSLIRGNQIELLPRFSASAVVDAIASGATIFMGVPTMYSMLLEHLEHHPDAARVLARARLFTSGSAALPADDFARFERLTGHRILERYGMTETLLTLSNPLAGERRPGCVGRPVPGCEVRVVADDGEPTECGEPGELWVRWAGIMKGYWKQPEASAAAFTDGWFRTGDVVIKSEDGYLSIVGRKSVDIIKSGGFKISSREIEEVIARHPDIAECAVVGIPDTRWGQRITVAVVVAREVPAGPLLDSIAEHVAAHLADYKKPRGLMVLDELPRNALGKLQKRRIIELARDGLDART